MELSYYTNVNWKVLFCNRYVKELAFAKRAAEENTRIEAQWRRGEGWVAIHPGSTNGGAMQVENYVPEHWDPMIDVLPQPDFDPDFEFLEDDEDDEDDDAIFAYEDEAYYYTEEEFKFYREGEELKYYPSYNPFYRLVWRPFGDFDEIKSILIAVLRGFRRNCKEVEENVDVLVTLFAKYLKVYPRLAEFLDPDKLGPLLYLRQDLYPDSKIAIGALSLMHSVRLVGTGVELEVVHIRKIDSPYHVHATNMLAVITNSNIDVKAIGDRLGLWDVVCGLIKKGGDYDILFCGFEILLSKSTRHLKYRSDSLFRKIIVKMAKKFPPARLNSWKYFTGVLNWPGDDQEELEELVRIYLRGNDIQVIAQIALLKSAAYSDYARKFLAGNEELMQRLADAIEQNMNTKKLYNLLTQK